MQDEEKRCFLFCFFVLRMFVLNAIVCLKNLGGMFEGVYFFSVVSMLNMESAINVVQRLRRIFFVCLSCIM